MQNPSVILKNKELLVASGNQKKKLEITDLLKHHNITLYSLKDFGIKEPEETGRSFVENAILKARNAAKYSNLPSLADDSGLIVDALHGEPGIYSARYCTKNDNGITQDKANINKLINKLKKIDTPNKKFPARYVCVLVFVKNHHDPCPIIIQKFWEGQIILEPKGENGFGYDPIFYIPKLNKTAAELTIEEKQAVSHRGLALKEFVELFSSSCTSK